MQQVAARQTARCLGQQKLCCARWVTTAPAIKAENAIDSADLPLELKKKYYPWLGDREIIGNGAFNQPTYYDSVSWPCPGIRFEKNSPAIRALREKEKGDWKTLTKDEKMQLYRASFRMTFSEFTVKRSSWKEGWAYSLFFLGLACFLTIWQELYVHPPIEFDGKPDIEYQVHNGILKKRIITKGLYDYTEGKWKD